MKKINKKEFDAIFSCRKDSCSEIAIILSKCRIGNGIILTKEEWNRKAHPSVALNNNRSYLKKRNMAVSVKALSDGGGWAIIRTK